MNIPGKPINDQVLIKVTEEKKTESGIILATHARTDQSKGIGTVIAMSPNAFKFTYDKSIPVKVGDKVLFERYQGTDFSCGKDEAGTERVRYRLVKDVNIHMIVEDSDVVSHEYINDPWVQNQFN